LRECTIYKRTAVCIIPKRNLARVGFEWLRVIEKIVDVFYKFLRGYFKRNLSETGFSADKRRFWMVDKRGREDRREWLCLLSGCCTTYLQ
jgi:transposase